MATYNVLVIDDDPNIRRLLSELLDGREEYRVLMAGEGAEAVKYFAEEKIDVVLTDIHMPGFTGIELMADMKKLKFQPEILVMTANGTPENVEKARQIGARSVILKPFDNLDVVEAEIDKAIRAVAEARGTNGNGHGDAAAIDPPQAAPAPRAAQPPKAAPAPAKPAAPAPAAPPKPAVPGAAKSAAAPALSTMKIDAEALRARAASTAPKGPSAGPAPAARPAPETAPPAQAPARAVAPPAKPIPVAKVTEEEADPSDAISIDMDSEPVPDLDSWRMEVTGNETPEPESPLAAARRKAMGEAPIAGVRPAPPKDTEPAAPAAARPAPAAPRAAPRAAAPKAPPAAPAPTRPVAARPAQVPTPVAKRPAPEPEPADDADAVSGDPPREGVPAIPEELESVLRAAGGLDAGRMKMQVPIVCLQTWEEQGAIAALRRLSTDLNREFYCWSAARGLIKQDGQAMGEMYREPTRALEFIRRHKNAGLYVLADFRRCLEDRTVVRELREMVMEGETARAMLVLTDPRLMLPPELTGSCVQFDWPGSEAVDLEAVYEEVMAEVSASSGKAIRLSREERQALFEATREMSAGRARFEMARALMSRSRRAG